MTLNNFFTSSAFLIAGIFSVTGCNAPSWNSLNHFYSIPGTPSAVTRVAPVVSPGIQTKVQVKVDGVSAGDTVTLYTDLDCTLPKGAAESSGDSVIIDTDTLEEGVYRFYARSKSSRGNSSACSETYATYQLILSVVPPNQVTLQSPTHNPGSLATPVVRVRGITVGHKITLFEDSACLTAEVVQATAASSVLDLTVPTVTAGSHTYYAQATSAEGIVSACSTAFASYTYSPSVFSLSRSIYSMARTGSSIGASVKVQRTILGGSHDVTLSPSELTAGSSDISLNPVTVHFDAEDSEVTISGSSFVPVSNGTVSGDEFFRVKISAPTLDGRLGAITEAQINLLDNQLSGEFFFAKSLYTGLESSGMAEILVHRSGSTAAAASVQVTQLPGTAISTTDYAGGPIVVQFDAGESEKPIAIPVVNRAGYQPNRSFYIELSSPSAGTRARSGATAKVRILDSTSDVSCAAQNSDIAVNSGFGGGDGTVGDPFRICSLSQFSRIRNHLADHFRVMADIDFDPSFDSDPDVAGTQIFSPISGIFSGTIQGGEYILNNVRLSQTSATTYPLALFRAAGGNASVQISGINVQMGYVDNSFSSGSSAGIVGTFVGAFSTLSDNSFSGLVRSTGAGARSGGILSVSVGNPVQPFTRNFSAGSVSAGEDGGGILAGIYANGQSVTLQNNYSTAAVSGTGSLGGLAAGSGPSATLSNAVFRTRASHAKGPVTAAAGAGVGIGGLIGILDGSDNIDYSIEDSFSTGNISDGYATGGIVGIIYCDSPLPANCDLTRVSSTGTISSSTSGSNMGGLVGELLSPSSVTIESSSVTGSVVVNGNLSSAGGFVGMSSTAGHGSSPVFSILNSHSSANVYVTGAYSTQMGGLLGYARPQGTTPSTVIQNSYVTGNVTAHSSGGAGGLISGVQPGTTGSVSILQSYMTGNVSGGYYVGGLTGSVSLQASNHVEIIDSYATGNVDATSVRSGGLVGFLESIGDNSSFEMRRSHYSIGTVSGSGSQAGGLIGSMTLENISNSSVLIEDSYNSGLINVPVAGGGIIAHVTCGGTGTAKSVQLKRVYASGSITAYSSGGIINYVPAGSGCNIGIENSYFSGTISGNDSAGLLTFAAISGGAAISITNSYSTGSIAGTGAGGISILPSAPITLTSVYWLKESMFNDTVDPDGNNHDSVWLKNSSNFTGWSFFPTAMAPWIQLPGAYPTLQ